MKLTRILMMLAICTLLVVGLSCGSKEVSTPTPTSTSTSEGFVLFIDISPSGGGTVERSSNGPYYYGDVVQITANPNSCCQFDHWGSDISGNTNPMEVTISGNTYIAAYFEGEDRDNDGLLDVYESSIGTNPYQYDTDMDGVSDGAEVDSGSNPLLQDTDSDGILDNVDLWPLADMKVQVNIVSFTELEPCDPVNAVKGPYCLIKIYGLPQVQLPGCTGSAEFNVPDNQGNVTVSVDAWDDDSPGKNESYDIFSNAGNALNVEFDRTGSPITCTGTGSAYSDACQATITIQIANIAGSTPIPTPAPTPAPTPIPTTGYISHTFFLGQGTLEVTGIMTNFEVGDTFEGYFVIDRPVEYGVTLSLQGSVDGKSIGYTSGESFSGTRTFHYTLTQDLDYDSLEVNIRTSNGNCSPNCSTDTKYVTLYYKLDCNHCQMTDTTW